MSEPCRRVDLGLVPGDGIGVEVMDAARAVLDALADEDVSFTTTEYSWSCERYQRTGEMMPADGLDRLREHDAVLLGAVGWPGVPDHVSLWGLLIPIRRAFDLYVNLRPIRRFAGVRTPVRDDLAGGIDLVVVRENSEGEYSRIGGVQFAGTAREMAVQEAVFTRHGVARVARYAAELAASRRGAVVSATKSNGIVHTMPFWDRVVAETLAAYPHVALRSEHIDALAAKLVLDPAGFDVVLASNLFGDILSDLAAAVCGSIGIAPSANVGPDGGGPGLFEPVHGSAPDIAGTGMANPIGMVWSVALMLDDLELGRHARRVMAAVEDTLSDPATRTRDVGGTASTAEATAAVVDHLAGSRTSSRGER